MKAYRWILVGILGCLAVAVLAYFWTTGLMDSLFAYRSPLHTSAPTPGAPVGQPLTQRVIFVLIDALRADTTIKSEVMPTLSGLREKGAWATMHSRPPSYSAPSYSVLLTGAWPEISDGPAMNPEDDEVPTFTQDDIFSATHRAGLKTAVSGYFWFEHLIPSEAVDAGFYTAGEDAAADRDVVDAAIPWLESGDYQLVLIHLDQVDYAGHYQGGPRDPNWDAASQRVDDLLNEIITYLDLQQDTLLIASDHGQIDAGGHGGQETVVLTEPFVLVGAGVQPGNHSDVQMVDVAPTIAALLGTNIPASSQGHVLTDILKLNQANKKAIQTAIENQQATLFNAYVSAISVSASPPEGDDIVTATQEAMNTARNGRLAQERVWRVLIAVYFAIVPATILFIRRNKKIAWLLVGGLLYVILFNVRYALLDGRTYSLSSVISQEDIILYTATTAALSLLFAWLATMLLLGAFRTGPRRAVESTLSLTYTTLYLLALPILLSYALNGATITWAMPDFLSMFIAFQSLIQCLMVAVLGLLLTGISALIAWPLSKRSK